MAVRKNKINTDTEQAISTPISSYEAMQRLRPTTLNQSLCLSVAVALMEWTYGARGAGNGGSCKVSIKDDTGLQRTGQFTTSSEIDVFLTSCSCLATVEFMCWDDDKSSSICLSEGRYVGSHVVARSVSDTDNVRLIKRIVAMVGVDDSSEVSSETASTKEASSSKMEELKIAFALGDESLKKLLLIVEEETGQTEIDVELSNGSSIKCTGIDQLLAVSNNDERRIVSIAISSPWTHKLRVQIKFNSSRYLPPIKYTVTGNDMAVSYLSDKLKEHLYSLREWYSPIAFFDFFYLFAVIVFTPLLVILSYALLYVFPRLDTSKPVQETGGDLLVKLILWAAAFSPFVLGPLFNRIRGWLFPASQFVTGSGIHRYKRTIFLRQTIGVGFFLSIVAGIITSLVLK